MVATIIFKEVEFEVEFDYQPEETMVMYYKDGSGYPGCAAAIEGVNEMKHKGTCFLEFYDDYKEKINDLILETLND